MYWLEVVWAVIRGIAGALSIEFDRERTAAQAKQKKEGPAPEGPQPGAAASAGPQAGPQENGKGPEAPKVQVDARPREGEFSSGLPFMGGPRVSPAQPEVTRAEGESRRKRRTRPAAATPAEHLCARCKAAIEHELTADAQDLAVPQEADRDEVSERQPAQPEATIEDPQGVPEAAASNPVSAAETADSRAHEPAQERRHVPLAARTLTRLGTRGSLMRMVDSGG